MRTSVPGLAIAKLAATSRALKPRVRKPRAAGAGEVIEGDSELREPQRAELEPSPNPNEPGTKDVAVVPPTRATGVAPAFTDMSTLVSPKVGTGALSWKS